MKNIGGSGVDRKPGDQLQKRPGEQWPPRSLESRATGMSGTSHSRVSLATSRVIKLQWICNVYLLLCPGVKFQRESMSPVGYGSFVYSWDLRDLDPNVKHSKSNE